MAPATLAEWLESTLPHGREEPTEEELEAADARLRSFGPRGALLRVELDVSHFLNWGLGDEASVLLRTTRALVADTGVEVTARFSAPDELHLGGLLWPEAAGRLAHTAYATREARGQGQVILFLGHPTFRAWTLETQRMFLNALILGPGLGTDWPTPW